MRVTAMLLASSLLQVTTAGDASALDQGRSAALDPSLAFTDCQRQEEVCGMLRTGSLQPFDDRCAARQAGATRILVGPCDDEE